MLKAARTAKAWIEVQQRRRAYAKVADAGAGPLTVVAGMPKSGTTTLLQTTAAALPERHVHHTHHLQPVEFRVPLRREARASVRLGMWYLGRHPATPEAPWDVVIPVREPVARLVSTVFYTPAFLGISPDDHVAVRETLVAHYQVGQHEHWLGAQLSPLGIDVYAEPFPVERGWCVHRSDLARVLVIRCEDLGRAPEALSAFFDRPVEQLVTANVGAEGRHADAYRAFLRSPRLPEEFVDRMLEGPYGRHFYSDEERRRARQRWTA